MGYQLLYHSEKMPDWLVPETGSLMQSFSISSRLWPQLTKRGDFQDFSSLIPIKEGVSCTCVSIPADSSHPEDWFYYYLSVEWIKHLQHCKHHLFHIHLQWSPPWLCKPVICRSALLHAFAPPSLKVASPATHFLLGYSKSALLFGRHISSLPIWGKGRDGSYI